MIDLDLILKSNIKIPHSKGNLNSFYYGLIRKLPDPEVVLEIGAFDASFSVNMKQIYPMSNVTAFEAGKYNYDKYRRSVSSIGVDYLNMAISNQEGCIDFYVRDSSDNDGVFGANGIIKRTDEKSYREVHQVECCSLDVFLSDKRMLNSSKAMWIDVEGSANKVLSGSIESLQNTNCILIEVEEHRYWEDQWLRKDIEEFLLRYNFVPVARDFEDNLQYDVIFLKKHLLEEIIISGMISNYFDSIGLEVV